MHIICFLEFFRVWYVFFFSVWLGFFFGVGFYCLCLFLYVCVFVGFLFCFQQSEHSGFWQPEKQDKNTLPITDQTQPLNMSKQVVPTPLLSLQNDCALNNFLGSDSVLQRHNKGSRILLLWFNESNTSIFVLVWCLLGLQSASQSTHPA